MFKVPAAAAFTAIFGATTAMAEIPSPTLIGVQRVVIACDADSSLTEAETQIICAQLVKKAQTVTRLPVVAATPADLHPSDPAEGQLLLQIALSSDKPKADRSTLTMKITPSRDYPNLDRRKPITSKAQLARLQNKLIVQGPVDAFGTILGSAPPKLHRPITSDL